MTAFAQIVKYVTTQLTVYERNKLPYWSLLWLASLLFIARLDNGKGVVPPQLILPWLVMFIVMTNVHLIICPFFATDDELPGLLLFPLKFSRILTAKRIAAAVILSAYVAVSFMAAMLIFPLSLTNAVDGLIYFTSTLASLFLLGDLPLWPQNIYKRSALRTLVLCTLALAASSVPFIAAQALPYHGVVCCLWIVLSFIVWQTSILPRSAGWIVEMKFKRDES